MTRWWQPSLARRVLFALLAAFLLVWCVLVGVDYIEYRQGYQRRSGLVFLAKGIVESLPTDDTGQAVAVIKAAEMQYNRLRQNSTSADVGNLLLRLETPDGRQVYASAAAKGESMMMTAPSPEKLIVAGRPYWSTIQETKGWRLQVLEPVIDDSLIVRLLGGDLLLPMLIAFPVVLLPLWLAVRRGLLPLRHLVNTVEARVPGDFSPLALSLKYAELQPLLAAFNHLLTTSRQGIERERAFVQDAAHELRTPLAVVSAQAHLLVSVDESDQQAQARLALDSAVQRSSHLVHQLLTLAALESGNQSGKQAIDLVKVTRNILISAAPVATTKGIELALESPDELSATLDASAYHSILGNLLDNALAYCPAGSLVTVVLSHEQDTIHLDVIDNGPGVEEANLARLTERFFRGSVGEARGSGLGLTIVAQAVKRMRGQLDISLGDAGSGLVVSVNIPMD